MRVDWKSISDEGLLYHYIYNPWKLGYNRADWGGTVLHPGDRGARTSLDPDHLTLPVFAFDGIDITKEDLVRERVSAFFPEMSVEGMAVVKEMHDGNLDSISFKDATCSVQISSTGEVDFYSLIDYSTLGDDIVGSNDTAKAIAFDYLGLHGGVPPDIGRIQIRHNEHWDRLMDRVMYSVYIDRNLDDLPIMQDTTHARIMMEIDGRTGSVMQMHYGWPKERLAFYVTDLPRPASVVKYHSLDASPFEAEDWDPLENLTYFIPDYVFSSSVPSLAGTTFMLPHWIAYEKSPLWPWQPTTHFCDAIFPDETVSS